MLLFEALYIVGYHSYIRIILLGLSNLCIHLFNRRYKARAFSITQVVTPLSVWIIYLVDLDLRWF